MRFRRLPTLLAVPSTALLLSFCSGSQATAPEQGSVAVTISPTALSLAPGSSGAVTVSVSRSGAFSGPVSVTVDGLPSGVTAAGFAIAASETSGTLTVTADASASAATANVTVHAAGTGVTTATATLALTVTAPPPTGGFSLSASPSSLSVDQGSSGDVTVSISRTGTFSGAVALSASGVSSAIQASFAPASVTGSQSTLTLTVGAAAATGGYTVTITGSASGLTDQTTTVSLTVNAPAATGNVDWTFCGQVPIWFAVKDGSGAWTQVTGNNGVFSFSLSSQTAGIAYVTGDATNGYALTVLYALGSELQAQAANQCPNGGGAGKTVSGTVTGLASTDLAEISLGTSFASTTDATGGAFTLNNVPPGNVDLVASQLALSGSAYSLEKLIIRRNLDPADGGTLDALDFGGTEAFAPVSQTLTIDNLNGDQAFIAGTFRTANGATLGYLPGLTGGTSATRTVSEIPADKVITGDFQLLTASAFPAGTPGSDYRSTGIVFHSPGDQTITLGPALTGASASVAATTPYAMLELSFPLPSPYGQFATADFVQGSGGTARSANITATGAYLGGVGSADLSIPDLSAAAGWNNAWGPAAGVSTKWIAVTGGWAGTGGVVTQPFTDGETFSSAGAGGTITP